MDAAEYEALLADVEGRLDRVRALYEQYFQGIERIEPAVARKEVDRRIARLRRGKPNNTALRFRFNSLLQKYTTYQSYWRRVVRQIEEGTYRRHLDRARKRKADRLIEAPPAEAPVSRDAPTRQGEGKAVAGSVLRDLPPPDSERAAARPSLSAFSRPSEPAPSGRHAPAPAAVPGGAKAPPRPPAGPAGRTPPPPPPGGPPAEPALRRVYDEYVATRKRHNQRTDHLQYEAVAKKLKTMLPELQRKHQGKKVGFKVVVKDGKVGLKPFAKEK